MLGGIIGATLHVSNNLIARIPYFHRFQNKTLLSFSLKKVALVYALAIACLFSINSYAGHSLKPAVPTPQNKKRFIASCLPIMIGSSLATIFALKKMRIFEKNMTLIYLIILAGNTSDLIKLHHSIK